MPERLQKKLAQAGYGSRRACEYFIAAGGARVNGKIAAPVELEEYEQDVTLP